MTGLEVTEEREQDTFYQYQCEEWEAAALVTAEQDAEEQEKVEPEAEPEAKPEARSEAEQKAEWVGNTVTQFSYLYANNEQKDIQTIMEKPGSQAAPLSISSDSEQDDELRRSGRVRKPSKTIESQQWQIDNGLIPAPGTKAKARALNAKKKRNTETSQWIDHFELVW